MVRDPGVRRMSTTKVECDCEDWQINIPMIDSALQMSRVHGNEMPVKMANYCLYCCKKINHNVLCTKDEEVKE